MTLPIKRKLTILQGATFRKRWTWKPGGVPMDFTGCKARMQVRAEIDSTVVLLELTTENCTPEAKVRFIPDSTSISLKLIAADGSIKVAGTATAGDTFRPIQYYMPWAIAHRDYPMFWVQGGTGIMHPKGVGVAEGDTIIISMDQVGDLITGAKLLPRTFLDEWLESPRAA